MLPKAIKANKNHVRSSKLLIIVKYFPQPREESTIPKELSKIPFPAWKCDEQRPDQSAIQIPH